MGPQYMLANILASLGISLSHCAQLRAEKSWSQWQCHSSCPVTLHPVPVPLLAANQDSLHCHPSKGMDQPMPSVTLCSPLLKQRHSQKLPVSLPEAPRVTPRSSTPGLPVSLPEAPLQVSGIAAPSVKDCIFFCALDWVWRWEPTGHMDTEFTACISMNSQSTRAPSSAVAE